MDLSPRTYMNRYSLSLGPKSRMSIDASEIIYIKQIGGGNFGQVYLAVSSHRTKDVPKVLITFQFNTEVAGYQSSGENDQRERVETVPQRAQFDDVSALMLFQ